MTRARPLSGPIPAPFLWLLVAALFCAKALVPAGWMPVADAGGVRIELCTAQGAITATLDVQGRLHKVDDTAGQARDACPFGVLAVAAYIPAPPVLAQTLPPMALGVAPLAALAIAPLPQGLRPPGQGPPASL